MRLCKQLVVLAVHKHQSSSSDPLNQQTCPLHILSECYVPQPYNFHDELPKELSLLVKYTKRYTGIIKNYLCIKSIYLEK